MALSIEEKKEILEELKKELNKAVDVYVEICREGIQLPTYANDGDAGMDIRAAEDIIIYPSETKLVPTGLKTAIPEGYEIQVRPRSGLSLKTPLRIANSPGTIDSGYRDEIGIIVTNTSDTRNLYEIYHNITDWPIYSINEKGNKAGIYKINKGDRIAQIVLCEIKKMKTIQCEHGQILELGKNRGGGFGHTGTK